MFEYYSILVLSSSLSWPLPSYSGSESAPSDLSSSECSLVDRYLIPATLTVGPSNSSCVSLSSISIGSSSFGFSKTFGTFSLPSPFWSNSFLLVFILFASHFCFSSFVRSKVAMSSCEDGSGAMQ